MWAAWGGHLEVLQWARANGCPWDEDTCSMAAHNGHLEVLQWARTTGCPWDERTCGMAVREGHRDVFLWAREYGCPTTGPQMDLAKYRGWLGDDERGE